MNGTDPSGLTKDEIEDIVVTGRRIQSAVHAIINMLAGDRPDSGNTDENLQRAQAAVDKALDEGVRGAACHAADSVSSDALRKTALLTGAPVGSNSSAVKGGYALAGGFGNGISENQSGDKVAVYTVYLGAGVGASVDNTTSVANQMPTSGLGGTLDYSVGGPMGSYGGEFSGANEGYYSGGASVGSSTPIGSAMVTLDLSIVVDCKKILD